MLNKILRQNPLYKFLLTMGIIDNTGPIQEKRGILQIQFKNNMADKYVFNIGINYSGTGVSSTNKDPRKGEFYLNKRSRASSRIYFVSSINNLEITKAFCIVIADKLGIRAPYRIIEKENYERIIIKEIIG